jgi:hypothetical protein
MMLERSDLKRLRLPLVAALLLAGVGATALVVTENNLAESEQLRKAGHDRYVAARAQLAKVSEEEQEIRNNLVLFKQISDRGMTGAEKRLEWIEALATIQKKRRLFQVQYNLDPQRPVDYPGVAQKQPGGAGIFMASRVKLELQLLHEEDLLNFFSDLRGSGESFASLRSCSISRAEGAGAGGGPLRPRLRASCVLDMITLKAPDKT